MIRRIFDLTSKKIIESNCNVTINYDEALRGGNIVGIGDSFITEWIDELKGTTTDEIKERYSIAKGNYTRGIKIKQNKQIMIDCEFIPELIKVEFTSPKHFDKLKDGFICIGERYVYFISKGTSSVTYIYGGIAEEFKDRLDNGRNKDIEFIPAKLNAYFSLTNSSSRKVYHQPKHVVVVRDNTTTFEATYLSVTTKGVKEVTEEVTLEASDGNGVIDYKLMQLWSDDLGYNGKLSSGVSIRNAFVKGMVFPIDLQAFFSEHGVKEITDVWGTVHSVEDVDMIIPTSMFKLFQSYNNYNEYETNCKVNGYEFRVCKESHEIKASRINYHFTTDLHMSEEQVERFIAPSIQHMKDVCGGDWLSTCLYLNGQSLVETSANNINSIEGSLMIAPELINDKIILDTNRQLTQKQRRDLCLGRYWVDSNYQILSSDLYNFLCSVCGIESKGLLKKGEVYSQWHVEREHKEALLFRSPMLTRYNIARVNIADSQELRDFFKYMPEIVVLNVWDLTRETLCGCDFDKLVTLSK